MKKVFFNARLVLLLWAVFCYDFSAYPAQPENSLSRENITGFVKYLADEGEYFRANTELDRLESYYPGFLPQTNLCITKSYFRFKAGQYNQAADKKCTSGADRIFQFDTYIKKKDLQKAADILPLVTDPDLTVFISKRKFLYYIISDQPDLAAGMIKDDVPESAALRRTLAYYRETAGSIRNPYSSLAMGAVPGLGYVNAGEKPTGIIAFTVISIMSAITYFAFKSGNEHIGIFTGAVSVFFYGGSIAGGYMATSKYNKRLNDDLLYYAERETGAEQDREYLYRKYGLPAIETK